MPNDNEEKIEELKKENENNNAEIHKLELEDLNKQVDEKEEEIKKDEENK